MKFEASNMYILNSFPSQRYPKCAISYANLPNPAPGTNTLTHDTSLTSYNQIMYNVFANFSEGGKAAVSSLITGS